MSTTPAPVSLSHTIVITTRLLLTPLRTVFFRQLTTANNVTYNLNILYYNARSILPKLDNLFIYVKLYDPHIICVTESWLSKDISDDELSLPGYHLFRLDRDRHGGGVLIYVLLSFSVTLHPPPPPSLELISLSFYFIRFKFVFVFFIAHVTQLDVFLIHCVLI